MSALRVVKFSTPRQRRVRTDQLSLDETVRAAWASLEPYQRCIALIGFVTVLPKRSALSRRLWHFMDQMPRHAPQQNIGKPVIDGGGDDPKGA